MCRARAGELGGDWASVQAAAAAFFNPFVAPSSGGLFAGFFRGLTTEQWPSIKEGVLVFALMFVAWAALSAAEQGHNLLQCSCNAFFY